MSAVPLASSSFGGDLLDIDYKNLAARWISPECANAAGLRRVDSYTGREMFGRKKGNCGGVIIPNILPGDDRVREYQIRLDEPDLEYRTDGTIHEGRKYLQPLERPNLIYFPPTASASLLQAVDVTLIITEGPFKCLALWRAATHESVVPRFLPIAVAGVWNFRGTVGKTTGREGDRRDVKGIIPDIDRIAWRGRRVVIAYDADTRTNSKVMAARARLSAVLIERGATVGFLDWDTREGKGIDDHLAAVGVERVLVDIGAVECGDWRTKILRNEDGKMLACYENVALFLENSPEWAGVLAYNEFTGGHMILNVPPDPITATVGSEIEDHFDTEVVRWLERKRLMVKPELVRRVLHVVARKNSFHPVRNYLEGLPAWDGTPRIDSFLIEYCGVKSSEEKPNHYAQAVGEKFFISAVARIYEPSCKVDHVLVLEGPQGTGKSTFVRTLAGEWFTDQVADFGSKDASMQLRGAWIIEFSELEALNRADMARVKAFISQQTERFRLPYGRRIVQCPRQCVFIGTTNSDAWLKDETGGRRFWPVRCGVIDVAALKRDRDYLWAEALYRYRSGIKWWLDDKKVIEEAAEEQRGRYAEDVWQPRIGELIQHEDTVSISEVLSLIGIDMAKQDQVAANRVARSLRALGWERFKKRAEGGGPAKWRYRKVIE